jgi:thiol:disulfide interchange protein
MAGMAQRKQVRRPPPGSGVSGWAVAAAVLLAVAAGAYYWMHRGMAAPAPVATPAVPTVPTQPTPEGPKHIYSETADPKADIAAALKEAKSEHKRVIVDFGGDWCGDCQVLDIYFHQEPNAELLQKNFVLVHVWIGQQIDANLDVPAKYGVPIHKGVPALAVLAPDGKVIYSQKGEFEDMRHMEASAVTEFLEKWKSS